MLTGIRIQSTHNKRCLVIPVRLGSEVIELRLRLLNAQVGVVALAVALIGVATCDRTFGLKVVGNGDERLGGIFGDRLEFLSQWLTRSAGEAVIFKDAGFAYWLYAVRVVDDCHADDVRGSGDDFRALGGV